MMERGAASADATGTGVVKTRRGGVGVGLGGRGRKILFCSFVSGDRLFSRTKNVKNMMLIEDYTRGLHNSHSQLA
jgi:hypothetical protein